MRNATREQIAYAGIIIGGLAPVLTLRWPGYPMRAVDIESLEIIAGMFAAPTLLLGFPQLVVYCLRYRFRGDKGWVGNPRLLTNIPLFMTGWAAGAGTGAALTALHTLLPLPAQARGPAVVLGIAAAQLLVICWLQRLTDWVALLDPDWRPDWSPARLFLSAVCTGAVVAGILGFLMGAPALCVFFTAMRALEHGGVLPAAFLTLAALPPLVAGLGLLRRAAWMFAVRRHVANLATSTARAASAGLVELRGKPVASGGEAALGATFELDDGTGRVRVEVPKGLAPGSDERLWLERGSGGRLSLESRVPAGSEVLVIGEFVPPSAVRPWKPPFGQFLSAIVDRFVDETLQRDADNNWNRLGFGSPSEVFFVTDLEEREAKAKLFSAWKRVLVLGFLLTAAAVGLLRIAFES